MRYLKIVLEPLKIKGDADDPDQLQADVYEKLSAMIESETLAFSIDEDEDEDDSDY
jgi:uncharacterized protein YfaA (DUF2138 family)